MDAASVFLSRCIKGLQLAWSRSRRQGASPLWVRVWQGAPAAVDRHSPLLSPSRAACVVHTETACTVFCHVLVSVLTGATAIVGAVWMSQLSPTVVVLAYTLWPPLRACVARVARVARMVSAPPGRCLPSDCLSKENAFQMLYLLASAPSVVCTCNFLHVKHRS